MTSVYDIPGSRQPSPIQTAALIRDPVGFLERCERRYGSIFRVKLIGYPRFVYVTDPALAREIYATDRTVGRAGPARQDFLEPMVGRDSLLCLEGDQWLRHRKLLGPPFHRRHVAGYEDEIAAVARDVIGRMPRDRPFGLRPWMQEITLEVILRLVFGVADGERLHRYRLLLPELIEAGSSPLIWIAPQRLLESPRWARVLTRFRNPLGRFLAIRDAVDELLYAEIRERRAAGDTSGRGDVLSMLLNGDEALSDSELRDELITLLQAGHETTATALAWAVERLVRTPDALSRLTAEVDEGVDEYLGAVVRESLRARSVVMDTPRLLEGPVRLGGFEIPRGWYVAPALPLVQRAAAGGADDFRPERFLEQDGDTRESWIPFGGGKRHCVGSHLALLEIEVVIRELVAARSLEPVRDEPERATLQHVTLAPAELALVRAQPRDPLASRATR